MSDSFYKSLLHDKLKGIILDLMNSDDSDVIKKHMGQIITGTIQEKGAQTFWKCMCYLYLEKDMKSWKFCYVLHRILRNGHPNCIRDSQQYRQKIDDLCKFWEIDFEDDFGKLDHLYYTLLKTKLDFHIQNPCFRGDIAITDKYLDAIVKNHGVSFQLLKDMFDYMDHILAFQSAIFDKLRIFRLFRSKQLKNEEGLLVTPLIPCLQDAEQLYKYSSKILFKLHSAVASNVFDDYQKQFLNHFVKLKQFFLNSSNLWYIKDFISIPSLPENPPNFSNQAGTPTQATPVYVSPKESKSKPLVDTCAVDTTTVPVENTKLRECLAEQTTLISNLQQEIKCLRQELEELKTKTNCKSLESSKDN